MNHNLKKILGEPLSHESLINYLKFIIDKKDNIYKTDTYTEEHRERMKNRKKGNNSSSLKEKWNDPVWRSNMLESRKKKKELKNETN